MCHASYGSIKLLQAQRADSSTRGGTPGGGGRLLLAPPPDVIRAVASLLRATGPGVMAALGGDGLRLLSVSRPERQPESAALSGPGPGLCCWVSVFSCFSLACSYVGSLYVWKSELPRCGGCARGRTPRPRGAGLRAGLGPDGGGAALASACCPPRNLPSPFLGTTLLSSSGGSPVSWWSPASPLFACYSGGNSLASRCEGGGAQGNPGKNTDFCGREHH